MNECMVDIKSRTVLNQYMKNESGIKLFVLFDNPGNSVDFYSARSGRGLSFDAVMSLVNKDFLGSHLL